MASSVYVGTLANWWCGGLQHASSVDDRGSYLRAGSHRRARSCQPGMAALEIRRPSRWALCRTRRVALRFVERMARGGKSAPQPRAFD